MHEVSPLDFSENERIVLAFLPRISSRVSNFVSSPLRAAAVLFAVNVTAVVPATPSNIGVFQLAVISVLHTGFGISTADALAYGVILQAVEIATAVTLGLPALVREGLTWSDLRVQALSSTPVRLKPEPAPREATPREGIRA